MGLYAFWVLRGYSLRELAALSVGERLYLFAVRDIYVEGLKGEGDS